MVRYLRESKVAHFFCGQATVGLMRYYFMLDEETTDVAPSEEQTLDEQATTETVREGQHLPTTEERLEHCYGEIRTLRSELAGLRAHSHPQPAHSAHEHSALARP